MDHNYYTTYNQYAWPGRMATFLLGLGPMLSPQPEEVGVAVTNHMINGLYSDVRATVDLNLINSSRRS